MRPGHTGRIHIFSPEKNEMNEKKTTKLGRRSFLKYALEGSLAFGVVGAMSAVSVPGAHIRPPGAVNAKEFTSKCMRCGACVEVCPSHCLDLLDLSLDIKNIGTPIIDTSRGGCLAWKEECLRCVDVCPTKALDFSVPLANQKLAEVRIREPECVNCMVCFRWCPVEGAVLFPDPDGGKPFTREEQIPTRYKGVKSPYKPYIDPDKCIGCGLCAHYCIPQCIDFKPLPDTRKTR